MNAEDFRRNSRKSITILGMSGVGKTTISSILAESGWYHYSCDHRIGTHYLEQDILENLTQNFTCDPAVRELIDSGTIHIEGRITIENLYLLSQFVGKIGNPEKDGLSFDEFRRRQDLYNKGEIGAVRDVPDFLAATDKHFIHDSSGSLCELDEPLIADLAKITDFVYIEATKEDEKTLLDRAKSYPKPLYYPDQFFRQELQNYMDEKRLRYVALIDPDDFCRWVFPKLFYSRIPKYKKIAEKYGATVTSEEVRHLKSEKDILDLVLKAIERKEAA